MAEVPKYQRIVDDLRGKILSGEYAPDDKLPTETELMDAFSAARGTVRQALSVLAGDGLTEARKGSGVRVRDVAERRDLYQFKPIVRVETTRGSLWKQGRSMWERDLSGRELLTDQLEMGWTRAPAHVARVIGTDDAGYRSRRYVVDGRPGLLSTSYLPYEIVRNTRILEPDTGPGGIYARLRDLGHEIAGFSMQVWTREAVGNEAQRLGLPPLSFVLCAVRTASMQDGRVVEVNEMVMNPAMYVLQFEWDA